MNLNYFSLTPSLCSPKKLIYPLSIQCGEKKWEVADPKISRLSLALMDMEAGLNGAASHWGGPSAFVEIVCALYALVFSKAKEKKKKMA